VYQGSALRKLILGERQMEMRYSLFQFWIFVTGMTIDTSFRIDIAEYYIEIVAWGA